MFIKYNIELYWVEIPPGGIFSCPRYVNNTKLDSSTQHTMSENQAEYKALVYLDKIYICRIDNEDKIHTLYYSSYNNKNIKEIYFSYNKIIFTMNF